MRARVVSFAYARTPGALLFLIVVLSGLALGGTGRTAMAAWLLLLPASFGAWALDRREQRRWRPRADGQPSPEVAAAVQAEQQACIEAVRHEADLLREVIHPERWHGLYDAAGVIAARASRARAAFEAAPD